MTTKVLQEAAVRGDQIAAMLAEMQHPRGAADLKLAEPISGIPGVSGWAACKHGQAAQTLTFVSREVMGESEVLVYGLAEEETDDFQLCSVSWADNFWIMSDSWANLETMMKELGCGGKWLVTDLIHSLCSCTVPHSVALGQPSYMPGWSESWQRSPEG